MQSINLNLVPGSFQQVFNCSQGDIGRQLTAKLFDGSTAYEIPAGSTVKIKATKPSGFGFDESATFSGSTVTITTAETMTNEWGRFPAELVITKDGNVIGTANFLFNIEKNPHPDSTVDGDAEEVIPELTLLVERVEAAASSVLDMEVVATTLPAGSQASYSYDEDLNKATFGIPQGEAGAGAAGVVASAYSSSKTYKVGDYVLHNSNLYRCITAITTAEAFTAAHWTQIVLADDVSDLKNDLTGACIDYGNNLINPNYYESSTMEGNVTINSDGSMTVGTSDYGTIWFGKITLNKGAYKLFGVPFGYSFLNTTKAHTSPSIQNSGNNPKIFIVNDKTSYWIGYRAPSKPSVAVTIYPSLYNSKPLALETSVDDNDYINQIALKGKFEITPNDMEYGSFVSKGYVNASSICRNKNHYMKARKGDIVVGRRNSVNILVGITDNPDNIVNPTTIYTTGWRSTDFAIEVQDDGYYIFLGYSTPESFDGSFTVYPINQEYKSLPEEYYKTELATTISSIKEAQTEPCICFPLITDIHYGTNGDNDIPFLFHKSYENIQYIIKRIRTDAVVCLGDVHHGVFSVATAITYGSRISNMFRALGVPYLLTIGNHDDNRYGGGSVTLTAEQMYEAFGAYIDNNVNYNTATNGKDFYIDFPNYKIRVISIDSNASGIGSYAYANDTVSWFTNIALDTPDGYTAIILTHVSPISSQNYNDTSVTNGNTIAQAIEDYINGGKPAFQLYGHSHCDVAFTSPYLSIATNCAKFENENGDPSLWPQGATKPTRTEGTATEDCWDFVIVKPYSRTVKLVRFGAGDDRTFSY